MSTELPNNATALLGKWNGGRAKLWYYAVSHCELAIRVEKEGVKGNLHIVVTPCVSIQTPVSWEGCNIRLDAVSREGEPWPLFGVLDEAHGVSILCRKVILRENVDPVF